MSRHVSRALLVVVGATVLLAPPAMAERRPHTGALVDDPAGDTTTTTDPPSTTTSTTAPTGTSTSTTSTTVSPGDPGAGGDVTGGVVPDGDLTVPPPDDPDDGPHVHSVAIVGDLSSARDRMATAEARAEEARVRVEDLHRQLADVEARILALTDEQRPAVQRGEESRTVRANRAGEA